MTAPTPEDQRLAGELLELARQVDQRRFTLPSVQRMTALHASVHNRLMDAARELRRAAEDLRSSE